MSPDSYVVLLAALCLVDAFMRASVAEGFVFNPRSRSAAFPPCFTTSSRRSVPAHTGRSGSTNAFDAFILAPSLRDSSTIIQIESSLRMAADGSDDVEFVRADDLEALQALFAKECDVDGLMSKASLEAIPAIAELLVSGP